MIPAGATPRPYTPIFDWGPSRERRVSLVGFLIASLVLHALCFYIFQIVYPLTVALLPPPARVNLITADSEQGRLLLRWVEAEDPALSSTTQRPTDTTSTLPPDPQHVPSYSRRQPALKQLPPYRVDLRIPSAQPPAPVDLPPPPAPTPAAAVASTLRFGRLPETLGPPQIPLLHFVASKRDVPTAARFRVGVDPGGAVRYCFLEDSSGDPALDEQARRYLLLCRFPSEKRSPTASDRLVWTTAILQWGNDIAAPSATSPESAAP